MKLSKVLALIMWLNLSALIWAIILFPEIMERDKFFVNGSLFIFFTTALICSGIQGEDKKNDPKTPNNKTGSIDSTRENN